MKSPDRYAALDIELSLVKGTRESEAYRIYAANIEQLLGKRVIGKVFPDFYPEETVRWLEIPVTEEQRKDQDFQEDLEEKLYSMIEASHPHLAGLVALRYRVEP